MFYNRTVYQFTAVFLFLVSFKGQNYAQEKLTINASADFVSRYIWRGLNVNDAPNIQPSLSLSTAGLQAGVWGSYSITQCNSTDDNYAFSHEIDTWFSYSKTFTKSLQITAVVTDYYFPNAGIRVGNFNNCDDPEGPGAHTLEAGLVLSLTKSIPLTFSGYVNFYNDKGNNTYFQIDCAKTINNITIGFFAGASGGSTVNPGYYKTDKFNIINLGVKANKKIALTTDFSLPIFINYTINPKTEIAYLIFGITIQ